MRICLIITNYNGIKFLATYLERISAVCQANEVTLVIADDNSKDESINYLTQGNYHFVINNNKVHGFAANANNGIKYARKEFGEFDHYIISNNDVVVGLGLFKALRKAINHIKSQSAKVGLIAFEEVWVEREQYFRDFDYETYNPSVTIKVNDIPGFFFIITAELIAAIGYMDEEYFIYGEDNDYYERTKKAGFSMYNTLLPVMHYSESSSTDSKLASWRTYRNAFLFAQKNLSFWQTLKMLGSFINQIYNPFFKNSHPSHERVRRHGFLYNNYLLVKSILWNIRYWVQKKTTKR